MNVRCSALHAFLKSYSFSFQSDQRLLHYRVRTSSLARWRNMWHSAATSSLAAKRCSSRSRCRQLVRRALMSTSCSLHSHRTVEIQLHFETEIWRRNVFSRQCPYLRSSVVCRGTCKWLCVRKTKMITRCFERKSHKEFSKGQCSKNNTSIQTYRLRMTIRANN